MKKYVGTLLSSLIMIGCGDTTNGIGTGYYVDSAVKGVSYTCGSQQGVTDEEGMFKFESTKGCDFSINGKVFKRVEANRLVDQVVVKEEDVGIARFLMTLDKDGEADTGIEIIPAVAEKVTKIPQSSEDFAALYNEIRNVEGYAGKPISTEDAQAHLNDIVELVAVAKVEATEVVEGAAVVLDASDSTISKGEIASYEWREGSHLLGSGVRLSKTDFSLGSHTITLTISNGQGEKRSDTVVVTIVQKTKWTGIDPLSTNSDKKLYMTSDENNLYFKLDAPGISQDAIFYINSDDSNISGLTQMGIWPNGGFDYAIKSNGLYRLESAADFDGKLVYEQNYTVSGNTLEFSMAKFHFGYLAKNIGVGVLFPNLSDRIPAPDKTTVERYTDNYHDTNQSDHVAPIITVTTPYILVDGNYTKPTATAYDIFEGKVVSVMVDDSEVKPSEAGFYTVFYHASDSAGNEATRSTVVEVLGQSTKTTLEEKSLTHRNEKVIIDAKRKLVWASDNTPIPTGGSMSAGCLFIGEGTAKEEAQSNFENYCSNSHYAGLSGWRAPTSEELSRFIVQAKQEGIAPGMGKSHCVQTVAVDNDGLKAVWTRMKPSVNDVSREGVQAGFIDSTFDFPAGGRCVRGEESDFAGDLISNVATQSEAKTIEDTETNLMWVNEFVADAKACLAIHYTNPEEYNTSKEFCQNLNYAGHDDWRDPTPEELSAYVNKSNEAHIFVGFEAPCAKLLARTRDDNGVIVSEKEVYTRYNGSKLGEIADLNITNSNIGLRCVREK